MAKNPWRRFGDEQPEYEALVWLKTNRSKHVRVATKRSFWWKTQDLKDPICQPSDLWCPVEFKPAPPLPESK